MRAWGLMLSGAACLVLLAFAEPAAAVSAAPAMPARTTLVTPAFHPGRSTSFYCYPRNYWWFYKPYTTAGDGYRRCMPYFHYPQGQRRGADALK